MSAERTVGPFDVVVCGGGLAGLTLGLQLRQTLPTARVAVVERTSRPLPEATHKVGESSVELGSHYFDAVLGLKDYLEANHLHKNGLRFFTGDTRGPVAERPEIGPAEFPIVPSYQLDRGTYETDLRAFFEDAGGVLMEGRSVRAFELGEGDALHRITLDDGGVLEARWMVDASGRARLISKRLGLRKESPNEASAAWFRVKGRVRIADLVPAEDARWHARDIDGNRWLSTVHMMGKGYWVWLIPLSTGYTSIGIVADHTHHPFRTYNKPERAWEWLKKHEPVLAERLRDGRLEGVEGAKDFRVVHNYSYLTDKAFDSTDRWACVGEAALFVDPLYSLGSDFLGMANCYTTRLIADDLQGKSDPRVARALNGTLALLGRDAARTLGGNGKIFPHADVFGAKLWWDFFNYWSFMCGHFFQRIYLQDADTLERFLEMGQRYYHLNTQAQAVLEGWAELKGDRVAEQKRFVPLPMFPSVLADQHVSLLESRSAEETLTKMRGDLQVGQALVTELLAHALRDLGEGAASAMGKRLAACAPLDLPLNPRFDDDALPRRERLRKLPPIGRDLERALGRREGDRSLAELWSIAAEQIEAAQPPAE